MQINGGTLSMEKIYFPSYALPSSPIALFLSRNIETEISLKLKTVSWNGISLFTFIKAASSTTLSSSNTPLHSLVISDSRIEGLTLLSTNKPALFFFSSTSSTPLTFPLLLDGCIFSDVKSEGSFEGGVMKVEIGAGGEFRMIGGTS
jgi:hypothetical protein